MYCWGEAKLYELNILVNKDTYCQTYEAVQVAVPATAIKHISIGDQLTAVLREKGSASVAVREQNLTWRKITLRQCNIVAACVGAAHVVLLTAEGALLHWNSCDVSSIPKCPANLHNRQVIQIACGDNHSVALIKDGQVFTWGHNSRGQLGLGKREPNTLSPQPLKFLVGIPLSQVSAGGDHSFALSLSGAVFGWGKNSAGQLGLGDHSDRLSPVPVVSLNQKNTISISCGAEHTALLTKEGVVFTCGSGRYGQLGHNSLRDELRPRLVAELWGSKVSQIACGRYHTVALIESGSRIYTFGCGEQGQLGNGRTENQVVPLPVNLPAEQNNERTIKRIFAGANQSFVVNTCEEHWSGNYPMLGEIIWKLDLEIAERWICSNSKSWTRTKRNIKKMVSSVTCVNGSFLEKSSDKHYLTSENWCGLDMSMARLFFERVSQNEKVLKEVESVVQLHLLPSLSPRPAGVEGLRVYLILPELLRVLLKQNRGTELAVSLAEAILRLHPDSFRVLESYWSRSEYSFFTTVVKNFHSVAKIFHEGMRYDHINYSQSLRKTVEMLQKLYAVNSLRRSRLSDRHFHIKEINKFFFEWGSVARQEFWELSWISQFMKFYQIVQSLTTFPCIFDLDAKQKMFQLQVMTNYPTPLLLWTNHNILHVKRDTLLKNTFEYLQKDIHNFIMPLKVKFVEEDAIDDGGVSQEFFRLLSKELTSKECNLLLKEESELVWFMPNVDVYKELGTIFGMACYNRHLLNIPFPSALFKKLLGEKPTLRDLEELSPCQARCLKVLLEDEDEELEFLEQDFTVQGQELIPNGTEVLVTKGNRQRFVELYVDYVLNKSVAQQFEAFAEGFGRACPAQTWKMFSSDELRVLICGEAEYVWEDLRKVAEYEGCESGDMLIQNFWTVLFEMSKEDKLKFLSFIYAIDKIPVGGLANRKMKIVRLNKDNSDEYFPLANTCYGTLQLPNYSSIDILRERLTHAINYCDVFGIS